MQGNTWIWVIVVIVILGGGFLWWQAMDDEAADDEAGATINADTSTGTGINTGTNVNVDATPTTATIIYNASSFSPSSVTIKKGGTVSWVNSGTGNMWVASAQHPTHTVYDGTSREQHCPNSGTAFDQCAGGSNYSFKFDKTGTWNYHDHLNATAFGKVVVVD